MVRDCRSVSRIKRELADVGVNGKGKKKRVSLRIRFY
jgi:hypothetical protein